ncbi:TPA: AlpA family transcriptional regulator [Pseudomonas aeruginosa]
MSQVPAAPSGERRIMRLEDVEAKVGFKRAHIYALMKKGEFPKAFRVGIRAVGWNSLEIDEWVDKRLQSPV